MNIVNGNKRTEIGNYENNVLLKQIQLLKPVLKFTRCDSDTNDFTCSNELQSLSEMHFQWNVAVRSYLSVEIKIYCMHKHKNSPNTRS